MSAYSITRDNAARDMIAMGHVLNVITDRGGVSLETREALEQIVAAIADQLPQPVPTEPTGDVVVQAHGDLWYHVGPNKWQMVRKQQTERWEDVASAPDLKIYHHAPSPEAEGTEPAGEDLEALIEEFAPGSGDIEKHNARLFASKVLALPPAEPMIPASKVRTLKKYLQECAAAAALEAHTTHGDPGSVAYLDAADHLGDLVEESAQ